MRFTFSILELWKLFRDRKEDDRQAIIEWLEIVAKEGRSLADIWTELASELEKGVLWPGKNQKLSGIRKEHRRRLMGVSGNIAAWLRLTMFYEDASSVLGNRVSPHVMESVIWRLGSLLNLREVTKQAYEEAFREFHLSLPAYAQTPTVNLGDLSASVQALHREAAALEVLLAYFKAHRNARVSQLPPRYFSGESPQKRGT